MVVSTGKEDGLYLKVIDGILTPCDKDGKPYGFELESIEMSQGVDCINKATMTVFVAGVLE